MVAQSTVRASDSRSTKNRGSPRNPGGPFTGFTARDTAVSDDVVIVPLVKIGAVVASDPLMVMFPDEKISPRNSDG
jgi:hypothetical protein